MGMDLNTMWKLGVDKRSNRRQFSNYVDGAESLSECLPGAFYKLIRFTDNSPNVVDKPSRMCQINSIGSVPVGDKL